MNKYFTRNTGVRPRNKKAVGKAAGSLASYPMVRNLSGLKGQCLDLWAELKDTSRENEQSWLSQKAALAGRLAVLCFEAGDEKNADLLLEWIGRVIPVLSTDKVFGDFARLDYALAMWRMRRADQALKMVANLPSEIADIFCDQVSWLLFRQGRITTGWDMACRSSQTFYKAQYLLNAIGLGERVPFDIPKLLAEISLKSDEQDGYGIHTLCLAAKCWVSLGAKEKAGQCLMQAMEVDEKTEAGDDLFELILRLESRLEIIRGLLEAGSIKTGMEMLKSCWEEQDELFKMHHQGYEGQKGSLDGRLDMVLAQAAGLEMQYGRQRAAMEKAGKALTCFGRDLVNFKLSLACMEQLRAKKALELAGKILEDRQRLECYGRIAEKCRSQKLKALSGQAYQRAREIAISGKNSSLWLGLSSFAVRLDNQREAIFCLSVSQSLQNKDFEKNKTQQWLLVKNYCRAGQYYLAMEKAQVITDVETKLRSLLSIWRHYRERQCGKNYSKRSHRFYI